MDVELAELERWLFTLKAELQAPELWAKLAREREALARPAADGDNTPFATEELRLISGQIHELKAYVRATYK